MLRKSSSGICSSHSGMTELALTERDFTRDRGMTSSAPPATRRRTPLGVSPTSRPATVRSSVVSTTTFS